MVLGEFELDDDDDDDGMAMGDSYDPVPLLEEAPV
jgi:hypothetical protein